VSARRAAALAGFALVATACGSASRAPSAKLPTPRGDVIRIGVERLPSTRRIDLRGRLHLVFVRVDPHRALDMFRRGELDEVPVPLGDIQAVLRDRQLAPAARIRRLRAIDVVVCERGGVLERFPALRRAYDDTADRADYQALVSELQAPAATSLDEQPKPNARAAAVAFSRAREQIGDLPRVAVRFAEPSDPELAYGTNLLVASWRDIGLGAYVGKGRPDARLVRIFLDRRSLQPARLTIPIAWAVDARLVSPRLRGWREDASGRVDYRRLRLRDRLRSR
jgi:hypothetical protein